MGERYNKWIKDKEIVKPFLKAYKADHLDKECGDALEVLVYPPAAFPNGLPISVSEAKKTVGKALDMGESKLHQFVDELKIRTVERESWMGASAPTYQKLRK